MSNGQVFLFYYFFPLSGDDHPSAKIQVRKKKVGSLKGQQAKDSRKSASGMTSGTKSVDPVIAAKQQAPHRHVYIEKLLLLLLPLLWGLYTGVNMPVVNRLLSLTCPSSLPGEREKSNINKTKIKAKKKAMEEEKEQVAILVYR